MGKKRKKEERSGNAMMCFLAGDEEFPVGYRPLSRCPEVIRCANVIANLTSSMTIMLMENDEKGDVRIKNELSRKIDISPHPYLDRKNFIFKIVRDMVIGGNSAVYPVYEGGEYLKYLRLLERDNCSFYPTGDSYYMLYKGERIEQDEFLHFVLNPDENYPFRGTGYKDAIIDSVTTLLQANETKKGFMKSKWKPSMIISINADVEELQNKDQRKKILGSYVDSTEVGEPWIIPAGEIDVKTINPLTLNDLAIQDSIKLDIKSIARGMSVPPFLVGEGDFNEKEYNNFIRTQIMGIAMIIQQQMTSKLLLSPHWYFKMNAKSLMQYDLKQHADFVKEMVSGGMLSRNEGRNEFDYSPAEAEGMDDYIVLENYIPVEKVGEQKKLKGDQSDE